MVIPCLEPVMTMAEVDEAAVSLTTGRKVLMPLMTPKKLDARIVWKLATLSQED